MKCFHQAVLLNLLLIFSQSAFANPYWDFQKVPQDSQYASFKSPQPDSHSLAAVTNDTAIDVLRITVDWHETDESYHANQIVIEASGTDALLKRSKIKPRWGSYLGVLKDKSGQTVYYDSIGTGKEYRKLARAISLRFPLPIEDMTFELYAENPETGRMEKVLSQKILVDQLQKQQSINDVDIRELSLASQSPSLRVNIYAEGYLKNEKDVFFKHAVKTVQALKGEKFPGIEHMSFYAVFHASNRKLGEAKNLGLPVPEYDSFLGLYYPYWDSFGRWYHIIYPTRENKFRQGLAAAPYDYPIVLVNHTGYWGVGNYMTHTAIPAANSPYFTYLLLHEFGHFFGLNEEYEGGGPTELEFAPGISEPWSQNITFLADNNYENLKWKKFVDSRIKLPTPDAVWQSNPPVYGAYRGGYGGSTSHHYRSHKPGLNCVMEAKQHFCDICSHAIQEVIQAGLGK